MSLTENQKRNIKELLEKKIEEKIKKYSRESSSMPFLVKLIQDKEKVAAYSFIHSLSTTLGMSVYEDVSKIIAEDTATECFTKYDIGGVISQEQKMAIDNIVVGLRNKERNVDIQREMTEVLAANPTDGRIQNDGRIADFYMLRDDIEHYFEIKTVKPNIDVFTKSKVKLLEWVARRRKKIKVFLAFPYNPYYPNLYDRFTIQGLMKLGEEMLVGEQYWDYLGGKHTFTELLDLFDLVGKAYKEKIATQIAEAASTKQNV